jgi:hypothetical protein
VEVTGRVTLRRPRGQRVPGLDTVDVERCDAPETESGYYGTYYGDDDHFVLPLLGFPQIVKVRLQLLGLIVVPVVNRVSDSRL